MRGKGESDAAYVMDKVISKLGYHPQERGLFFVDCVKLSQQDNFTVLAVREIEMRQRLFNLRSLQPNDKNVRRGRLKQRVKLDHKRPIIFL